jgi:hypothetical protein
LSHLDKKNKECKYAGYLKKYLKYPACGAASFAWKEHRLTRDVISGRRSSMLPFW